MKQNLLLTGLFTALCSLFIQCTQNPIEETVAPEKSDTELLQALGYDTQGMVEFEEFYLLLPDQIIPKSAIKTLGAPPKTRMQEIKERALLDENHQTIYLKDNGITTYRQMLAEAVAAWNNVENTNLLFIIDNNAGNAVSIVGEYSGDIIPNPITISNYGNQGDYPKYIVLNYSRLAPLLSDQTHGKHLMMHILGHIVGFGHSIDDLFNTPASGHIPGTSTADSESIMRDEKDVLKTGKMWTGFSRYDILAIQQVYPPIEPFYNLLPSSREGLDVRTKYLFEAEYSHPRDPAPLFDFEIIPLSAEEDGYEMAPIDNGRFHITFSKPGTYKVIVKISNVTEPVQFERTYTVYSPDPWLSAPAEIEINKSCFFGVSIADRNPNPVYTISVEPPLSNSDYEISSQSAIGFYVRFITNGTYRITVSRPGNNYAEKAYCYVCVGSRIYGVNESLDKPGPYLIFAYALYFNEACLGACKLKTGSPILYVTNTGRLNALPRSPRTTVRR